MATEPNTQDTELLTAAMAQATEVATAVMGTKMAMASEILITAITAAMEMDMVDTADMEANMGQAKSRI